MDFKRTPVALAVAALIASPVVFAENGGHDPFDEEYDVSVSNEIDVSLSKSISVSKSLHIGGEVDVNGNIQVNASAMSVVDDKQINTENHVSNVHHENNASTDVNALSGASGNIGVNIASGDNNMQDNAAAISAADAYFVFGSADSEVFVTQVSAHNSTLNSGNVNNATVSGNALMNASGNIGVNVTSGNSNMQKNNMAVSVAPSRLSEATVANVQRTGGNETMNEGRIDEIVDRTEVSLSGGMLGVYGGWTGGSYAGSESGSYSGSTSGSESGSYSGTSDQIGNVYPDIWVVNEGYPAHDQHPHSPSQLSHLDLDTDTQGGTDLNDDGGALAFTDTGSYSGQTSGSENGSYSGSESGSYEGREMGFQALHGTFSGSVATVRYVVTPSENNAHLGGNALANASGNIGVNIASGTNNLQNNSMAMAVARPALGLPGVDNGGME